MRIPGPGYLIAITRTRPFLLIILGCEQTFSSMRPFVKVHKDRFTRREIGHQRFAVGRLENREGGQAEMKGFSMEQVFHLRKDAHA